jgi:flavin-binding protein dodecin
MSKPTHDGVSSFTGRSETSMDGALEDAARQAIRLFAPGTRFDVVRQQVVISNPQVTEYRAVIIPT